MVTLKVSLRGADLGQQGVHCRAGAVFHDMEEEVHQAAAAGAEGYSVIFCARLQVGSLGQKHVHKGCRRVHPCGLACNTSYAYKT